MLTKELIERLYDAANSQRWNDHLRPQQGFTELDKQAHKVIIAYVIARYEEDQGRKIDWRSLIEGGMFEFLHRTVVTDIKPPVYYELMSENGQEIDAWVIKELESTLKAVDKDFFSCFSKYFLDHEYSLYEKRILKAAHYLATDWEFRIVYKMNRDVVVGIEETRAEILNQIKDHYDLIGVQKVSLGGETQKFIDLVGQLRFQKRWAQSPRIPETSVMGHMLIVAILGYFCAKEIGACDQRLVNDYICGLFHDLPEVLTRDIISPVKRSVEELDEKIKKIEKRHVEEKIFPLIPKSWHEEIKYFTENEFTTRIKYEGMREDLPDLVVPERYDRREYSPVDGRLLKCCDNLAALVEAVISYKHGVFSHHLLNGIENIRRNISGKKECEGVSVIAGIDFGKIMDEFYVEEIIKQAGKNKFSFYG